MPFGRPPSGGPLSRVRSRISASSLTKYLRCKKQWFLSNKLGLSTPKSISQILGVILEDSLCAILMKRPNQLNSIEEVTKWAFSVAKEESVNCYSNGKEMWEDLIWKKSYQDWGDIDVEMIEHRLKNGVKLFLEEVKKCYDSGGGPYLDIFRSGKSPYQIPSPSWGDEPTFPIPEKVRNFGMRSWSNNQKMIWKLKGEKISWNEAWEIARPWIKDPRVHQPQRLFHPSGWAAGELDMVLRWDGKIRIIDIKSGNKSSKFAGSLKHQLNFYSWLWHETHDGQLVDSLEGWYLDGPEIVTFSVEPKDQYEVLTNMFKNIHLEMQELGEGPVDLSLEYPEKCENSAGCYWCYFGKEYNLLNQLDQEFFENIESKEISLSPPSQKIGSIQSRVNVRGNFTGQWGPLPNHYSEPVLGAMISVSGTQITVEESEPKSFERLHDFSQGEVTIMNALPGVWRGNPRLYLDRRSSIELVTDNQEHNNDELNLTRIGLMRTKANVEGVVLSIAKRNGVKADEKPWSMVNFHIWDGKHVVEVVAFGSSINNFILDIKPSDLVKIVGAELGWRSGLPQLRIDQRSTRITKLL